MSSILVVDDDPAMRDVLAAQLARRGHAVRACASAAEALAATAAARADVVVTDVQMRDTDGLALCRELATRAPDTPVIVITAFGSMETAVLAMRAGAFDCLSKPFRSDELAGAVARAAGVGRARRGDAGGMLGASPAMADVHRVVAQIAPSDAAVLVTGESGTGKELVSRAIHAAGPRARGPWIAVNCAAMPAALLESELFGHAKGAFTGATDARSGLFAAAHGGTLFLDEIGELPLELQPKLLRALQERVVRPIGATAEVPFDARLVTATNRDLDAMAAAERFRADLLYRIQVIQIAVPPLRARGADDVRLLAHRFIARAAAAAGKSIDGLSDDAAHALVTHAWPGNVRELENCMAHAVAFATGRTIEVAHLPPRVVAARGSRATPIVTDDDPLLTLDELERQHVARVLDRVAGNKSAAARVLGIERKTLYRMLERWP